MAWAVSGSISRSGGFIIAVDTAHATDASTAVHTPNHSRCGPGSLDRPLTMTATPLSVRNVPTATATLMDSCRNAAASTAAPIG